MLQFSFFPFRLFFFFFFFFGRGLRVTSYSECAFVVSQRLFDVARLSFEEAIVPVTSGLGEALTLDEILDLAETCRGVEPTL